MPCGVAPLSGRNFTNSSTGKEIGRTEGSLANTHFKYFYTAHFGLTDGDYAGKFVADIGCGPRGTLEWATMASRRVGVDPLANGYVRLGASRHKMEYINTPRKTFRWRMQPATSSARQLTRPCSGRIQNAGGGQETGPSRRTFSFARGSEPSTHGLRTP